MEKHGHENEPLPPGVPKTTVAPKAPRLRRPPFRIIAVLVVVVVASWIPLVLIARARTSKSTDPRIQPIQDMGTQPKFREQQTSVIFADGRADRPRLAGTVAFGQADVLNDESYSNGFTRPTLADGAPGKPVFAADFPDRIKLTPQLLERGRERYAIYCSTCHGLDGYAKGMTVVRSQEIGSPIAPSSLHDESVRNRPVGHLYNTVNNGIRNMLGYGGQITSIEDRWAVVAYVRALQQSQLKK